MTALGACTLVLSAAFMCGGCLMALGALVPWEWVLQSARPFTGRMPRQAVRAVYLVLGLAVCGMALSLAADTLTITP